MEQISITLTMKRRQPEEGWREQEILQTNPPTENGITLRKMILMESRINEIQTEKCNKKSCILNA